MKAASLLALVPTLVLGASALASSEVPRSYKCTLHNYETQKEVVFNYPEGDRDILYVEGDGYFAAIYGNKDGIALQIRDATGGQVHAETDVRGFPDAVNLGCLNVSKETANLNCVAK